jgi:uncharacterized membrane protein YcjF (UPF0283 family)
LLGQVTRKPAQIALVFLMVLASLMLVGNVPIWIWIASKTTESQQAGLGPYALVAVGILATVVALVLALSRLNRLYERVVGERRTMQVRMPWLRSMRDAPARRRGAELTVLDAILIATAILTFVAFLVWFAFFAGSPLPS